MDTKVLTHPHPAPLAPQIPLPRYHPIHDVSFFLSLNCYSSPIARSGTVANLNVKKECF